MRLTSLSVIILFVFLSYNFSEPLSDYKGRFLLMFQSSDIDMENIGQKRKEYNKAHIYNMAAIRDANLIIIRALTDNALTRDLTLNTPRSNQARSDSRNSSQRSQTRDILDESSASSTTSEDILNNVRREEAQKLLDAESTPHSSQRIKSQSRRI